MEGMFDKGIVLNVERLVHQYKGSRKFDIALAILFSAISKLLFYVEPATSTLLHAFLFTFSLTLCLIAGLLSLLLFPLPS